MRTQTLTAERLRSLLHYDPETGIFMRDGRVTGTRHHTGYLFITVDRVMHLAHRLAWLYVKGEHPANDIDHKDLNRANNRFANLRPCDDSHNQANKGIHRNTSGHKGVTWHKQSAKWQAGIKRKGRSFHLGLYDCPAAAHLAYVTAANRIYGEFARSA